MSYNEWFSHMTSLVGEDVRIMLDDDVWVSGLLEDFDSEGEVWYWADDGRLMSAWPALEVLPVDNFTTSS